MSFISDAIGRVSGGIGDTFGRMTGSSQAADAAERAAATQAGAYRESAQMQSEAAKYAAKLQADAAREAAQIGATSASEAARLQAESYNRGIDVQQAQFDSMLKLMSPYVNAGLPALTGQQDILGLRGTEAQKAAYSAIEQSPAYLEMVKQSENALLQNASATGGLRGGNTQGALAQFRPAILSQLIDQQYSRLGGMVNLGQSAAAGQSAGGANFASNLSNLYTGQGNAMAGGVMNAGLAGATGLREAALAGATGSTNAAMAGARGLENIGAAQAGGIMAAGGTQRQMFGDLMGIGGAFIGAGGVPGIKKLF